MRKNKKKRGKRLPPYARALAQARLRNLIPRRQECGHVVISLEWRDPAPDYPVVVLPEAFDPFEFDWRFLAGLDVFVMHSERDKHKAYRVVEALFDARVHQVEMFNMDAPRILRFKRLFGDGHAR